MKFSCDEFYMKSAEEMAAVHRQRVSGGDGQHARDRRTSATSRSRSARSSCRSSRCRKGQSEDSYLREQCIEGLKGATATPSPRRCIARLDYELSIVVPKGISAYFLIVQDFTQWAKEHGIGVGPGRGSAAGSIIAYALGITNLDPIANGLLFERFLNPERTEMPDIDMDFDDERRGDVIDYVKRQVRRRQGRADHHVRHDEGARCGARRRPGARLPVRRARQDQQDDHGGPERDHRLVARSELRVQGRLQGQRRTRQRIVDAARSLEGIVRGEGVHAAGGRHLPRPAALLRPGEVRHQGRRGHHAVRRPDRRRPRPAQDGLPRPAHAHRHRRRREERRAQPRHRARARRLPARRPGHVHAAPARRHGRRVPGRVARHAPAAQGPQAHHLRRHRRGARALPSGSAGLGHGQGLRRAQARASARSPTTTTGSSRSSRRRTARSCTRSRSCASR